MIGGVIVKSGEKFRLDPDYQPAPLPLPLPLSSLYCMISIVYSEVALPLPLT